MSRAATGEVALLASPGNHLMLAPEDMEQRKSRRAASRRGASPPPPPISRRTSLTLSSFSTATLTAPLLPMSLPTPQFPPFAEFQRIGTPPVVTSAAVASMPVAAAARPPTRRYSSRLAAAAMAATVPLPPAPSSDRKPPARRKRTAAKVPRRNAKEAIVAPTTPTADDTPPKKPPSPESTLCCICMSHLHDAGKEVARISCCTHEFCTPCILQWSQTENSCPLCKQRFTQIVTQHPDTPRSSQRKRRSRAPRRITVPHRTQRSEAGRVLDSILQSLHGGGAGGVATGFAFGTGTPPTQIMPWIVRGDASVELEQFLRRFFVSTTNGEPRLVFGHSAETAIEIHDPDETVVELE